MTFNGFRSILVASFILAALLAATAAAQTANGSITGIVKDSTGAVIPDASVVARNEATSVEYRTTSSGTGNYVIPNLPIGSYELTASIPGFKTWSRSKILVASSEVVRVDPTMEVGQITERIQVVAEAPALQTETMGVSSSMERKQVQDIPVPMGQIGGIRNALTVAIMMPEVRSDKGEGSGNTPSLRIGGGQSLAFSVSVDGQRVEVGWRNLAGEQRYLTPPVDAVEEFRVDTGSFKASDQQASGGMISLVTKSGTNQFHGSLFEFYQSQRLNANSWLNNKLGRDKSIYHRNDFGFTAGGPVFIPKVYNGKDKSHFFVAYEGYRFPQTIGVTQSTVPTAAMRNGDFGEWVNNEGQFAPIYDPRSTRTDASGNYVRDAFPGNVIPSDRISPISAKISSYYPDPNAPGFVQNYNSPGAATRNTKEFMFSSRFDQSIGSKNRLGVTFTRSSSEKEGSWEKDPMNPRSWPGLPYPLGAQRRKKPDTGRVLRVNDTHVLTPNIVNTLTFGYHRRWHWELDMSEGAEPWSQTLGGIKNAFDADAHFPALSFATDNYTGGNTSFIVSKGTNVFGVDEGVSWIRGNHNLQFGYSMNFMLYDEYFRKYEAGTNTFHRLETAWPADSSGNSGNSFASFLLGAVHSGGTNSERRSQLRYPYHAFYVQDDWKVTPRLTVNVGFRFELALAVREVKDEASYFDPSLPNPAADGFPGALRYLGDGAGREGKRTFFPAGKGYGPRLGIAYQLTPETVVRAGAGIYYQQNKYRLSNVGFFTGPRWSSTNQGIDPAYYWDDGYPDYVRPPFIDPSFNTGLGMSWPHADNLANLPMSAAWNLAVSRALPGNVVLDLTYSGNKGTHLSTNRLNYMQIDPQYASLGKLLNRPIDDPAVVELGFTPPFPSFKSLMGKKATLGQALRMFPQYLSVGNAEMSDLTGNSTYHSFLVRVTKRYSNGLSLLASYAWSKFLTDADATAPGVADNFASRIGAGPAQNHYDRSTEKSYSIVDMPQVFKATFSYDLPFGKGRPWITSGIGNAILGGWNLAGFVVIQSGYPLGVIDSGYNNFLFAGPARPNILTHDLRAPTAGDKFDPDKDLVVDASAVARRTDPSVDPFGDAPRFVGSARFGGVVRENITVQKRFHLFAERVAATVRWEVYDLFNRKTWDRARSLDVNNRNFGKVTTAWGNRKMQLGLKLQW